MKTGIHWLVGIALFLFYGIVNQAGYDFIFLLVGLPIGCWLIWSISREET